MQRKWLIYCLFFLIIVPNVAEAAPETVELIVEVNGSATEAAKAFKRTFPTGEVLATYDTLFHGMAIKIPLRQIPRLKKIPSIIGMHPNQTYRVPKTSSIVPFSSLAAAKDSPFTIPSTGNQTTYTGKGIKVAVIDTGIDSQHPDLKQNIDGGFDLVDLDDDPKETTEPEMLATNHGTHVAGIIAANGKLKGIAPNADLYIYRALGPGGAGTSAQVMAAMEEAIKDEVDIINLSLGNIVNGPDYPTSKAVNEASKHGVIVVVAAGNTGPENWTVGAPATATNAVTVGAFEKAHTIPALQSKITKETFQLLRLAHFPPWTITRDYQIAYETDEKRSGKIVMIEDIDEDILPKLTEIERSGAAAVLLVLGANEALQTLAEADVSTLKLPLAMIDEQTAERIKQAEGYLQTIYEEAPDQVAAFSSGGPVTVSWELKPDIIAPGVQIMSTVPGGYAAFDGTSMATPYVSGIIALMKEAKPDWTNERIVSALKTTAKKIDASPPVKQGAGLIQVEKALQTKTIIDQPALSFGKVTKKNKEKAVTITIENISDEALTYRFLQPKKDQGIRWNLPQATQIAPKSSQSWTIKLETNQTTKQGIHDGFLTLQNERETFHLPYVFIQEKADYPEMMGFTFQYHPLGEDVYRYEFYLAEKATSMHISLYDPDTLAPEGTLMTLTDLDIGMHRGEVATNQIEQSGMYYGIITIELADGSLTQSEVFLTL